MPKPKLQKADDSREECGYCQRKFNSDRIATHEQICSAKKENVMKKVGSESSSEESSDEEDCREECGYCNRKFNADRIAKHEQICGNNASKKKRKSYKSATQQRVEGTDFETFVKANIPAPELPPSRWRNEHCKLQGMVEQSRLLKAFKDAKIPLSKLPPPGADLEAIVKGTSSKKSDISSVVEPGMMQCPHCTRTFTANVAERHIPKCKNTVNKPKLLKRVSKPVFDTPQDNHSEEIIAIIRRVLVMKNRKNDFFETKEASMFKIGEEVTMRAGEKRSGFVRFVGRVPDLFPGYWVGVELTEQKGNNDGTVNGSSYFACQPGFGLCVRPSKLRKVITLKKKEENPATDSAATLPKQEIHKPESKKQGTKPETKKQEKKQEKKPEMKKNMADRLREEVKQQSPRLEKKIPNALPDNLSRAPKKSLIKKKSVGNTSSDELSRETKAEMNPKKPKRKPTNQESKAQAMEAARQQRIEKDAAYLEALHSKSNSNSKPNAVVTSPKKVVNESSGSRISNDAKKPADVAAARAAYFEKMFANKQATQ